MGLAAKPQCTAFNRRLSCPKTFSASPAHPGSPCRRSSRFRRSRPASTAGLPVNVAEVRAAALLHDLAKTYTIRHGGNHCQLGGAWVQEITGNPALAQGVVCHVSWPETIDLHAHFLPLAIIYSDKRVKHNRLVTLEARFDDLLLRYGKTAYIRGRIHESFQQAEAIERALAQTLGMKLHESTFGCGGLVE